MCRLVCLVAVCSSALSACASAAVRGAVPERRFDLALYTTANAAAIREREVAIRACYANSERAAGGEAWTFSLRWHVDEGGNAERVEIVEAPFDDAAIAECVLEAALEVRFAPRRRLGTVVVTQRLPVDAPMPVATPSAMRASR